MNADIHLTLLQIRSTPLGPRLLSVVKLVFNRPVGGQMAKLKRPSILFDNDETNHAALVK